jgi:hypothetical protein
MSWVAIAAEKYRRAPVKKISARVGYQWFQMPAVKASPPLTMTRVFLQVAEPNGPTDKVMGRWVDAKFWSLVAPGSLIAGDDVILTKEKAKCQANKATYRAAQVNRP